MSDLKADIKFNFDAKKGIKTAKGLKRCFVGGELPFDETLDLIGELMKMDNIYFMEKIYPSLRYMGGHFTNQQWVDIDKHMLEKYCLIQGEKILTIDYANVAEKKVNTSGRIFVTNYRIIVCGQQVVRSAQKTVQVKPRLMGSLVRSGITHKRKALRKAITKALSGEISNFDIVEWGYFFPISNAQKINRTPKMISYIVNIETEKKTQKMSLKITPTRLKKQPKPEFLEQSQKLLDQIEQLLHQHQ